MKKIIIINGPNLNLLGKREPSIYGTTSFEDFYNSLLERYTNVELSYFQSNCEGALIDKLQEVGFTYDAILLNAGAYSHTSIALADAISSITAPTYEIHISNTFARASYRHHSYLSAVCEGVVIGFGLQSYKMALDYVLDNK